MSTIVGMKLFEYSKVSLIPVNCCMQNTAISKTRTKRGCFSYGYKLDKWFEQCRNTKNAHGVAASDALLRLWRCPQFVASIL